MLEPAASEAADLTAFDHSGNVPEDQQPVQELQALRSQACYDWPELKVAPNSSPSPSPSLSLAQA
jgi:hypothetical protein